MCHPLFLLLCLSFGHPLPDALTSVLFLPFLLSRPCPFRCPSSLTWPPRLCSQREPSSRSGDTATERWRRPPFHRAPAVIPTPWLMPPLMPPSPAHWPVSLTAIIFPPALWRPSQRPPRLRPQHRQCPGVMPFRLLLLALLPRFMHLFPRSRTFSRSSCVLPSIPPAPP